MLEIVVIAFLVTPQGVDRFAIDGGMTYTECMTMKQAQYWEGMTIEHEGLVYTIEASTPVTCELEEVR